MTTIFITGALRFISPEAVLSRFDR